MRLSADRMRRLNVNQTSRVNVGQVQELTDSAGARA